MVRIKDPQVSFIEDHVDSVATVMSYFPEYTSDGNVTCPFHDDTQASLHISPEGKAYCHGCGWQARDIIDLVAKLEDTGYEQVKHQMCCDIANGIPEILVMACIKNLLKRKRAMAYLREDRNLPDEIIEEYRLGYEVATHRITIPIYNEYGICVNIRRFKWMKGATGPKVLNMKGHGGNRLFPENKVAFERRLLFVEGEWDTLVGRDYGLPTCTWTGGATSWGDEGEKHLLGKAVWILYDNDKAGKQGADLAFMRLKQLTAFVGIIPPLHESVGKDLTDWSKLDTEKMALPPANVKAEIDCFKFPEAKVQKRTCPHCKGKGVI